MRCPFCSYQSPFSVVRCPHCEASFGARDLEELGHVAYLRDWLEERRDLGVVPESLASELIAEVDRRRSAVETALGMAMPAPAAVSSGPAVAVPIRPVVAPEPARIPPVAIPAPPPRLVQATPARAAAPTKPSFSWAQAGTYLLSERTLHALLGLGALLILASGVVISTLNPTGLGPVFHLAAVLGTTVLFYAAGYVVRQRLRLTLTGAALLGIGGAFIPLAVWTLGQEIVRWQPGAIWLAASLLCLPVYVASHALLRDRTFAVLIAVAGGSQLLALVNWLGVPLEWGLALLVGLAAGYVYPSGRLGPNWSMLSWALASTAQVSVPPVLVALLAAKFFPAAWEVAARKPLGDWYEYAIGGAWWLGAVFFAYAALRLHQRYLRVLAIWTIPVAYLLTLTKAPWEGAWHNVALAVLAGVYVTYARWRLAVSLGAYRSVAREPVCQAGFALSILAAFWPPASADSRIATLLVLALVYSEAAILLRQRAWAFVAVYLLPITYALLLNRIEVGATLRALAWAVLSAAVLAVAEAEVRRTAEGRRPLLPTIVGRGKWKSLFAAPLFSAGYAAGLLALWLAWLEYWTAPAVMGVRQLETPDILAFLALVGIAALSSIGRRASVFLYIASWLFLIPFTATAGQVFTALGRVLPEAELARLLALLGVAYLAVAYLTQRIGERYARPMYLVGYVLSLATMLLSALDRAVNVQVVGLSILVYAGSAWLVHAGRHLAYAALIRRLFGDANSIGGRHASSLFMYLASWLFPAWLLLAMGLRWPAPAVADYGLALALLAPVYAATGLLARRIRPEYRWPWYLGGYALSAVGPLVATTDANYRLLALTISIGLYVGSSIVSRRSAWLYPVALLAPVLVWQGMDRLALPGRFVGPALVLLALVYGGVGVVLHHGIADPRRLSQPIREAIGLCARPFFLVGYALCAVGLALVASQDRPLVATTFVLAAALFAGSGLVFRQSLFGYALVATAAVAYVVAMTLTPLDARYFGLGLLPGIIAALAVAEVLRRRIDAAATVGGGPGLPLIERWAAPFYAATYLGTAAVPAWSTMEQGVWASAWWSVAVIYGVSVALFRQPIWLYPTLGTALVAYEATTYALVPQLAATDALAALVVPGVLLFGGALVLTYGRPPSESPSLDRLSVRALTPHWADPLTVGGWAAMTMALLGSANDPTGGTRVGAIAAITLAVVATFWRGRVEAWGSLAAGAVAFEDALRWLNVPTVDQPPRWALAALMLSVLAIAARRRNWSAFVVWSWPLFVAALVAGAGAIVWAVGLQVLSADRNALQPLSATVALSGLTLVTHGFDRRERLLVYQGVALLEIGYMLQLLFFDVGQPQAFVLPAGGYLLAVAYLEWRRGTDARVKGALELAALTILLGISIVQAVGFLGNGLDRHLYASFLLLESVAVFGLGAVLHWRRSFLAGMLALVVDVAILLADPLRALDTWYLAAVIGLAMIAAVIFIEQRRKQIPFWLNEWHQRLEAWE